MTPDLFRATGEALFGSNWKTDMARALGVSEGMIRHYVEGRKPIHAPTWTALAGIIRDRRDTLSQLDLAVRIAAKRG